MITTISYRDRAMLRAVAAGRCEISGECLRIDGIGCCDQFAGLRLIQAGLIAGSQNGPARLTPIGEGLLQAA